MRRYANTWKVYIIASLHMVLLFSCALPVTDNTNHHHVTKVLPKSLLVEHTKVSSLDITLTQMHSTVGWIIQLTDGNNINLNRDDSAGFMLDTFATNKQYASPTVAGECFDYTYYVNRYPSTLQTSITISVVLKLLLKYVLVSSRLHLFIQKLQDRQHADFDMLK